MEPDREAMVCDNSMHFSVRTLVYMTHIIQIIVASSLPTTENNKKFGFIL